MCLRLSNQVFDRQGGPLADPAFFWCVPYRTNPRRFLVSAGTMKTSLDRSGAAAAGRLVV
jgi:hypothetical protein